jgi:hypothetical protein
LQVYTQDWLKRQYWNLSLVPKLQLGEIDCTDCEARASGASAREAIIEIAPAQEQGKKNYVFFKMDKNLEIVSTVTL